VRILHGLAYLKPIFNFRLLEIRISTCVPFIFCLYFIHGYLSNCSFSLFSHFLAIVRTIFVLGSIKVFIIKPKVRYLALALSVCLSPRSVFSIDFFFSRELPLFYIFFKG